MPTVPPLVPSPTRAPRPHKVLAALAVVVPAPAPVTLPVQAPAIKPGPAAAAVAAVLALAPATPPALVPAVAVAAEAAAEPVEVINPALVLATLTGLVQVTLMVPVAEAGTKRQFDDA
jgi:hypothetical protein